jgi:uncharacterized membrane protein YcaP (DUF421 family)
MDTVVRVAILYVFIMVGLRILGKRELSQLSPFDLVVLLLIPDLSSQGALREDYSLTNSFIALTTLLSLVFLTSMLSYRSKRIERVVESGPVVLAHEGRLIPYNMDRERVTPGEVMDAVHEAGLETLADVKWAILAADGKITVVPRGGRAGGAAGSEKKKKV